MQPTSNPIHRQVNQLQGSWMVQSLAQQQSRLAAQNQTGVFPQNFPPVPATADRGMVNHAPPLTVRLASSPQDKLMLANFLRSLDNETFSQRFWTQSRDREPIIASTIEQPHLMCFSGDKLVGITTLGFKPGDRKVDFGIVVAPDARGRAVGHTLQLAAIQFAKENGFEALTLSVSDQSHAGMHKLVRRDDGFQMVDRYIDVKYYEYRLPNTGRGPAKL